MCCGYPDLLIGPLLSTHDLRVIGLESRRFSHEVFAPAFQNGPWWQTPADVSAYAGSEWPKLELTRIQIGCNPNRRPAPERELSQEMPRRDTEESSLRSILS